MFIEGLFASTIGIQAWYRSSVIALGSYVLYITAMRVSPNWHFSR